MDDENHDPNLCCIHGNVDEALQPTEELSRLRKIAFVPRSVPWEARGFPSLSEGGRWVDGMGLRNEWLQKWGTGVK